MPLLQSTPHVNAKRLETLFLKLCSINSPALQEREVVDWTKTYLQSHGLEVKEDKAGKAIGGNANNLIAWLRGTQSHLPKIFLSAHFDTVEPTEGLIIEEKDGIWSSCSDTILGADDKGGMAPAIEAVIALKESGIDHGDICLLLSVAEEIGLKGANALELDGLGLSFGYVLDTGPPVGSFVNRTATHDKIDFIVHGVPAHAGKDPENGINAISVAAKAISNMKLGRIDSDTTANLGIINGGTAVNVVCPSVTIHGEARSVDVEKLDRQVGHMIQCFEQAAKEAKVHVEIIHHRHYEKYNIQEDSEVVRIALKASENLGFVPELRQTLGGSDANIYNAKGLQCIVVATGMSKIHTHDENISRKDLTDTAELALQLLLVSGASSRIPS